MTTRPLVEWLTAAGWRRDDIEADLLNECGWIPDSMVGGVCSRPARWEKRGVRACAQHARMIEGHMTYEDRRRKNGGANTRPAE